MSKEIVIEKNVPLPQIVVSSVCKYPFRDLEVGDSFAFNRIYFRSVQALARKYGRAANMTFVVHVGTKITDEGRVWRTA